MRRVFLHALIAAVAVLVVLGLRPSPMLVDTGIVDLGRLAETIEEEGRTRVRDSYVISAPLTAHAGRVQLDVGDVVREGDVVAILDAVAAPALDVRSIAQARALVEAAKNVVSQAREEALAAEAAARFAREEF